MRDKHHGLKNWSACLLGIALPLVIFLLAESIFRILNLYPYNRFEESYITYDHGLIYYPEWERKIHMPKPPDTYRIFILGGSAAQSFGVEKPFSKFLDERLNSSIPVKRFEVINGGVGAAGSHRVFEVLKHACTFDPDLIVVYLGHNEFLEDVFFDSNGLFLRMARLSQFLRQSHVINYLSSLVPKIKFQPKIRRRFMGNFKIPRIRSEEQYKIRLDFLGLNLGKMIDYTTNRKVDILFLPAVPNLLAPIGYSIHRSAHAVRSQEYGAIEDLLKATMDFSERVKLYAKLIAVDNQPAFSHHRLGLEWLEMNELEKGKRELLLANQLSRDGDRANSDIKRVITDVCEKKRVPSIDLWDQFNNELVDQYRYLRSRRHEDQLFLDHCHPTVRGHEIIAKAISEYLIDRNQWE